MEPQTLTIETRESRGKGAARQLRMNGKVPGVLYGPGTENAPVQLAPKELERLLKGPHRRNTLIKLSLGGEEHFALVKDLQVHPVTRAIRHVDLYKVSLEREVDVTVPFGTKGRAKGVVAGGELHVVFRELPLRTTPDKVPAKIVVDVAKLDIGDAIRVKDLVLDEGVRVSLDPERSVVAVASARKRAAADEEDDAAAG